MVFEKTTHFKLKLDFIAFSLSIQNIAKNIFTIKTFIIVLEFDCVRKNAFSIEEHTFIWIYGENEMINASLKAFRTLLKLPSKWTKEGVSQDCF